MRLALGQPYFHALAIITVIVKQISSQRSTSSSLPRPKSHNNSDILCNNGTEHACICHKGAGDLDGLFLLCEQFLEVKELETVSLKIRHINLSATLHNGESYESHFKRQIATAVSKYCEQQANECPGTALRLEKVDPSDDYTTSSENDFYYDDDYSHEPLITQDNVIVLSVKPDSKDNSTTIGFVVTNAKNVGALNHQMVMNSKKVTDILSVQLDGISRGLGGVRIRKLKTVPLKRHVNPQDFDNTKLLIMLAIIGLFLSITYIIAVVKVCRDHRERQRAKKRASSLTKENNAPDYGSCVTNKSEDSKKKLTKNKPVKGGEENTSLVAFEFAEKPTDTPILDRRNIQRMFQCDPSQLPAESLSYSTSPSLEDRSLNLTELHEEPAAPTAAPTEQPNPPSLVVVHTEQPQNTPIQPPDNNDVNIDMLSDKLTPQRESQVTDSVVDKMLSPTLKENINELIPNAHVMRSRTAHKFDHWSSDSEDDEHNDLYRQLSEAETVDSDKERLPNKIRSESEKDSDEREEIENNECFEERHLYQRLEETPSPMPSPTLA